MGADILPLVSNLGIGGFAIYIMWKMFDSNTKEREKHLLAGQLEREKYLTSMNESHKEFVLYQQNVQKDIMTQLSQNTDALTTFLSRFLKK